MEEFLVFMAIIFASPVTTAIADKLTELFERA